MVLHTVEYQETQATRCLHVQKSVEAAAVLEEYMLNAYTCYLIKSPGYS